jgi:hypothetical protein
LSNSPAAGCRLDYPEASPAASVNLALANVWHEAGAFIDDAHEQAAAVEVCA